MIYYKGDIIIKTIQSCSLLLLMLNIFSCAGTLPVTYVPQNFARYQGKVDIGKFKYLPADQGIVKQNQIQNTV